MIAFDDNAEVVGDADHWGYSTAAAISVILEESIELQSLIAVPIEISAASSSPTTPSEVLHRRAPAQNLSRTETEASPENSTTADDWAAQEYVCISRMQIQWYLCRSGLRH